MLPVAEIKPLPTSCLKGGFKFTAVPKYVLCSVREDYFLFIIFWIPAVWSPNIDLVNGPDWLSALLWTVNSSKEIMIFK